jgi:hypothetical protein
MRYPAKAAAAPKTLRPTEEAAPVTTGVEEDEAELLLPAPLAAELEAVGCCAAAPLVVSPVAEAETLEAAAPAAVAVAADSEADSEAQDWRVRALSSPVQTARSHEHRSLLRPLSTHLRQVAWQMSVEEEAVAVAAAAEEEPEDEDGEEDALLLPVRSIPGKADATQPATCAAQPAWLPVTCEGEKERYIRDGWRNLSFRRKHDLRRCQAPGTGCSRSGTADTGPRWRHIGPRWHRLRCRTHHGEHGSR